MLLLLIALYSYEEHSLNIPFTSVTHLQRPSSLTLFLSMCGRVCYDVLCQCARNDGFFCQCTRVTQSHIRILVTRVHFLHEKEECWFIGGHHFKVQYKIACSAPHTHSTVSTAANCNHCLIFLRASQLSSYSALGILYVTLLVNLN